MYIRRDPPGLRFGRSARWRGSRALLIGWGVMLLAAAGVLWQFDRVQDWTLRAVGVAPSPTASAVTLATEGERAFLSGDLDLAVDRYGQAAALVPTDSAILFEYGRALIYRSYAGRDYASYARRALEIAQQAPMPEDARVQALVCWALVENGQPQEAIHAGLRAVELAPDFSEAYAYLALAYLNADRATLMADAAAEAVALNPDSLDARRALALALTSQGQLAASIEQYQYALRLHPRLAALYFELAAAYRGQQNYEAATAAYDHILAQEPGNVKAYTRLCETYFTLGEWSQAQEGCEQAAQLDPTYSEAFQWLGKVRYKRRNFEGAVEALETCAALQAAQDVPLAAREVDCYYVRGLSLAFLGQCDQAMPVLQDALLMNPIEDVHRAIYEGMTICTRPEDEYNMEDLPTPVPATAIPPDLVEIY